MNAYNTFIRYTLFSYTGIQVYAGLLYHLGLYDDQPQNAPKMTPGQSANSSFCRRTALTKDVKQSN